MRLYILRMLPFVFGVFCCFSVTVIVEDVIHVFMNVIVEAIRNMDCVSVMVVVSNMHFCFGVTSGSEWMWTSAWLSERDQAFFPLLWFLE